LGVLFEDIDFFQVVNFFLVNFEGEETLRIYSSNVILITPEIGIASTIPSTPPRVAQRSITINTKKGERSSARLITYGTRKSFSTLWIMR
jgi:hypothetical protein